MFAVPRAVLILALLASSLESQDSTAARVSDRIQCSSCRISIAPLLQIGPDTGIVSIGAVPEAIAVDGKGRFWVAAGTDLPKIFDSKGRFVQAVGRAGPGVGEILRVTTLMAVAGDSVLIVDAGQRRATLWSGSVQPGRSIGFRERLYPGFAINWPSNIIMSGAVPTVTSAGWPLHRVSFAGDSAQVIASFGSDQGRLPPGPPRALRDRLALSTSGAFWAADEFQYRIVKWSADGNSLQALRRQASWFPGASEPGIGTPTVAPSPAITAIYEDSEGLIWVFGRVASKKWREGWPAVPPGTKEIPMYKVRLDKFYGSVVEVINPKTRSLVARQFMDQWIVAVLPGNRAVTYSVTSSGAHVRVVRFGMVGR